MVNFGCVRKEKLRGNLNSRGRILRRKVLKTASESAVKVTLNIKPVKLSEVAPWQCQLVRQLWTRLISQVQSETEDAQKKPPGRQASAKVQDEVKHG